LSFHSLMLTKGALAEKINSELMLMHEYSEKLNSDSYRHFMIFYKTGMYGSGIWIKGVLP